MKIAVLTLPLSNNYGGNLQAYALMQYLKKLGHDPVFIDLVKPMNPAQNFLSVFKSTVKHLAYSVPVLGKKISSARDISVHSKYFIQKYIRPATIQIRGDDEFSKLDSYNFGGIIVGSDQVWRLDYVGPYIKAFFLEFAKNNNQVKIAYAASFGVDCWQFDQDMTTQLKGLIHKFDLVTVREDSAVKLCKAYFDVNSSHVIDPTMLLEKEDYLQLIKRENTLKTHGNCMVYVLDASEEKQALINRIAIEGSFVTFTVNALSKKQGDSAANRRFPPTTDWLRGFMDAEFVVTDSFHGMVFSIIFNKPFIVIGNKQRGFARFSSIARMFNVESRVLESVGQYNSSLLVQPLNWNSINQRLTEHRLKAHLLLSTHLK